MAKGLIALVVLGVVLNIKAQSTNQTCPNTVDDPEIDVLLPHESNCTQFYKCSHGVKVLHKCPSNLYFNTETNACDWPKNVNCQNNATSSEVGEGSSHESSEEIKDGSQESGSNGAGSNENGSNGAGSNESGSNEGGNSNGDDACPSVEEDPEEDILFPHESDCTKFYKCSHGKKTTQNCPDGLHYNPEVRYCDWAENANCSSNNTVPAYHQQTTIPHESDCSKFYIIFNGVPFEYNCPSGLYFNIDVASCDYKSNVKCHHDNVNSRK